MPQRAAAEFANPTGETMVTEQKFGPDADSTPPGPNTDVIVVGPRISEPAE